MYIYQLSTRNVIIVYYKYVLTKPNIFKKEGSHMGLRWLPGRKHLGNKYFLAQVQALGTLLPGGPKQSDVSSTAGDMS